MIRRPDSVAGVERFGAAWPGALPRLPAFHAAQTPGEIVGTGGWHMRQLAQVDATRRPAARTLDLQPGVAAIDGLVDRGRRVDRPPVGPHPFIPALAGEIVRLADQRLAGGALLERALGRNARHGARLGQLFGERLAVAARQRRGVTFRRHDPPIKARCPDLGKRSY
jgi:hypothetical protein